MSRGCLFSSIQIALLEKQKRSNDNHYLFLHLFWKSFLVRPFADATFRKTSFTARHRRREQLLFVPILLRFIGFRPLELSPAHTHTHIQTHQQTNKQTPVEVLFSLIHSKIFALLRIRFIFSASSVVATTAAIATAKKNGWLKAIHTQCEYIT